MFGFYGIWRGDCFGGGEVGVKMVRLRSERPTGGDKITGGVIGGGDDRVVDWMWKPCNVAFESDVVPEDWRSAVIIRIIEVLAH